MPKSNRTKASTVRRSLTITLDPSVLEEIDKIVEKNGTSRSWLLEQGWKATRDRYGLKGDQNG